MVEKMFYLKERKEKDSPECTTAKDNELEGNV